mmetsp:Transcript_108851/g.306755  ORF Transcript_108851/g.306755 Transcript_108851/m.306755 type:complete len:200 (+) Transcript_108851:316-915(+)
MTHSSSAGTLPGCTTSMCETISGSVPLWLKRSLSLRMSGLAVRAAAALPSNSDACTNCNAEASMRNSRKTSQCWGLCSNIMAPKHHPKSKSVREGMQIGHASSSMRKPRSQTRSGPPHCALSVATYVATPLTRSHTAIGAVRSVQQIAKVTRCRSWRTSPATRGVCKSSSLPGKTVWRKLSTRRPSASRGSSASARGSS